MAAGMWRHHRSQLELSEFRQVTQSDVADGWAEGDCCIFVSEKIIFFPLGLIWPSGAHVLV